MDILDTRDLNKRLNELEDEREDLEDAVTILKDQAKDCDPEEGPNYDDLIEAAIEALQEWDDEYKEELDELYTMRDEISEWQHGETLIAEEDFVEYAEQLANDLYGVKHHWPFDYIDWDAAADDLRSDYSTVNYQGTTYLYRG
jgi:antirestriction protein